MIQGACETKRVTRPSTRLVAFKSGSTIRGGNYKVITLISPRLQITFPDFNIVLRNEDLKYPGLKGQSFRNR